MIKIFIEHVPPPGEKIEVDGQNHHHLKVVRVTSGDRILLGDLTAREFTGEIVSIHKNRLTVCVVSENQKNSANFPRVRLYVGMPKKQKLEDIVFRCTQLGVSEFVPFLCSRTEKRHASDRMFERLRAKALHGSELSRRIDIPVINDIIGFEDAVERISEEEVSVLFWEEAQPLSAEAAPLKNGIINIFIGPEGGFTREEVDYASARGVSIASLGELILDVETACITSVARAVRGVGI